MNEQRAGAFAVCFELVHYIYHLLQAIWQARKRLHLPNLNTGKGDIQVYYIWGMCLWLCNSLLYMRVGEKLAC